MFDFIFNSLQTVFTYSNFEVHSVHFSDNQLPMWLMVLGNTFSFIAYLFIPIVIIYFVRKRRDLYLNWMVLLFGAFIFLCGLTHGLHVMIFWYPAYYLQAVVGVITFLVSFATAIALLYFLPRIVKLVSPKQLEEANKRLSDEIESYQQRTAELQKKKVDLEEATNNLVKKNEEMERFNKFMEGREAVFAELESKLNSLKKKHA